MLSSTLLLDDRTGTELTYKLRRYLTDGSVRYLSTSTVAEPTELIIKHQTTGKGADAIERHLISIEITKADASGVKRKGVVNVTFAIPTGGVTNTDVKSAFANIVDLLAGGGFSSVTGFTAETDMDAILLGES